MGFPDGASGKEPVCQCRRQKRWRCNPWVRKRSLAGYSPWGHKGRT